MPLLGRADDAALGSGFLDSLGCTKIEACNYNPDATEDDGSCEYFSCAVLGCAIPQRATTTRKRILKTVRASCPTRDSIAMATASPMPTGMASAMPMENGRMHRHGRMRLQSQCHGRCRSAPVIPDAGYDCDGNCIQDTNSNGICDVEETNGCTDASACNYDGTATLDNGSCEIP